MATVDRDDRGIWGKAQSQFPRSCLVASLAGWLSNSGVENGWYAALDQARHPAAAWLFGRDLDDALCADGPRARHRLGTSRRRTERTQCVSAVFRTACA